MDIFADYVNRDESMSTMVPVIQISVAGILVDVKEGDRDNAKRVATALIPWHRVWSVYSHSQGIMIFETKFRD